MKKINIDEKIFDTFKSFVFEKHGKLHGALHKEAERALNHYMEAIDES